MDGNARIFPRDFRDLAASTPLSYGRGSDNGSILKFVATAQPTAWATFWQSIFRFQREKVNPWIGLRNMLGVAIPLATGASIGNLAGGVVGTTGVLNVAFRDSASPYAERARQMILASFIAGFTVFTGEISGHSMLAALLVAAVWTFAAGMLVAISDAAADVGTMSVVILVIYSANPASLRTAALAGTTALGGGLLQTSFSLIMWFFRRRSPERRTLAELYLELSRTARAPRVQGTDAPPATAHSLLAQTMVASLGRDRSAEAERFRFLLSQAERIRLGLLALGRIRGRLGREEPAPAECAQLDRALEVIAEALDRIGKAILESEPPSFAGLDELERIGQALRSASGTPQISETLHDARVQVDAIGGQLRAAADVAGENPPDTITEVAEAAKPWRLRIGGKVATLVANLNFQSAAFRHAVRLTVCVVIGEALGRAMSFHRAYWIPMTIAIVLKPDFGATFQRGVLRLGGTYIGLVLATLFYHALPDTIWPHIVAVAVLMFVVRCFGPANYGIVTIAISALVVFLFSISGIPANEVIAARALNTSIGGAIALLAYWLWPTWERTRISETAAQMLDAFRDYFRAIRGLYTSGAPQSRLDRTRVAGRLARSNLEASISRASSEPGISPEKVAVLTGMLASSRRLAQSLMSLEAASSSAPPVRKAFEPFANDVELTLDRLAAALRGADVNLNRLPDLREDHHALIQSGDASRYALANVETDRITNSLDTLAVEVRRWLELAH